MSIAEAAVNYVCSYYEEDFPHDRIRMNRIMGEGIVYEDEFIRITATLNRHIENSYSFLVEADGRRVVFSGDLSQNLKGDDFPKILSESEVDLFICEMAHFGEDEVLPNLKTCKAKRVIFNHYQKVKEEHIERLSVAGRFPFPVSMAQDMQSIEL